MNNFMRVLLLCCLLLFSAPAFTHAESSQLGVIGADDVDFDALTCKRFIYELQHATEDEASYMIMWLDGFLGGANNDRVVRSRRLELFGDKLVQYCASNMHESVIDASVAVRKKQNSEGY